MLNVLPYNVTVPEFLPERDSPIYPQITKRYPCDQNKKGLKNSWGTLTFKIQQPDPTMVWTAVKLVLPMKLECRNKSGHLLDMRVSSRKACCNIALQESPMNAFISTSLTVNGKIFSAVNDFRRMLDCCYQGTGPSSYGDNHSLKPVVCRDLKAVSDTRIQLQQADGTLIDNAFTSMEHVELKTSHSAFSLLENNGPFIERARRFQDELEESGLSWQGLITSYLELGPFQARGRKGNTSVPFIRDFHMMLNFAENPSQWDTVHVVAPTLLSAGQTISNSRSVPVKLFEFGTVANLRHFGDDPEVKAGDWISTMDCTWQQKPYLEVTYTKYIEPMKSFYNLRCFERQYEQSKRFQLAPLPSRTSKPQRAEIVSRLLSMPTKIYLYAELADTFKGTWMLGGVRRSCCLKNIHCTLNNRPDIVHNPSQEECFETFQRHTNSSLEFATWKKSPIYVFTPTTLQQSDFFSNDARLTVMRWDAEVSLTPLQNQESQDCQQTIYQQQMGYRGIYTDESQLLHTQFANEQWWMNWDVEELPVLQAGGQKAKVVVKEVGTHDRTEIHFDARDARTMVIGRTVKTDDTRRRHYVAQEAVAPSSEDYKIAAATTDYVDFRGFLWAKVTIGGAQKGDVVGDVFYVPSSHEFTPADELTFCNTWCLKRNQADSAWEMDTNITASADDLNHLTWKFAKPKNGGGIRYDRNRSLFGGGPTAGAICCPGPWGFVVTMAGITGGVVKEGQGAYTVIDNLSGQVGTHVRWVCFNVSIDMRMESGAFAFCMKVVTPSDMPGDATYPFQFPIAAGENLSQIYASGSVHAHFDCDITRSGGVNNDINMRVPNPSGSDSAVSRQGFSLQEQLHVKKSNEAFEYQMKALYEYGNAQYQFSADGLPTKVLPNLVPVKPNRDIPILQ